MDGGWTVGMERRLWSTPLRFHYRIALSGNASHQHPVLSSSSLIFMFIREENV